MLSSHFRIGTDMLSSPWETAGAGFLPPIWGTWLVFGSQLWPSPVLAVGHVWGLTQQMESVSPSLLSSCYSAFQINKNTFFFFFLKPVWYCSYLILELLLLRCWDLTRAGSSAWLIGNAQMALVIIFIVEHWRVLSCPHRGRLLGWRGTRDGALAHLCLLRDWLCVYTMLTLCN